MFADASFLVVVVSDDDDDEESGTVRILASEFPFEWLQEIRGALNVERR